MSVIEDMYEKSIQPSERSMQKDKIYRKSKNKTNQYYKLLCERLTEYQISLLDKLVDSYDKKTERQNIYCFKTGFKTGLTTGFELME